MPKTVQGIAPPHPDVLPVLAGMLRDAALLAERGTAGAADIDTSMRLGAGHPIRPFELLGLVRIRVRLAGPRPRRLRRHREQAGYPEGRRVGDPAQFISRSRLGESVGPDHGRRESWPGIAVPVLDATQVRDRHPEHGCGFALRHVP